MRTEPGPCKVPTVIPVNTAHTGDLVPGHLSPALWSHHMHQPLRFSTINPAYAAKQEQLSEKPRQG